MPSSHFKEQLAFGAKGEARVLKSLLDSGKFELVSDGNDNSFHDFEVVTIRHVFRVEVKDESRYANSQNLCLEMYQGPKGFPSGILKSGATITVHLMGDACRLYRTNEMQVLLTNVFEKHNQYPVKLMEKSDNMNKGMVIPISRFRNQYTWFDEKHLSELPESKLWMF